MALRKEEFYYDPREKKPMEQAQSAKRQSITIDISAELNERIQVAASQQNLPVDQYLEYLLSEALSAQHSTQQVWKPISREGVQKLMQKNAFSLEEFIDAFGTLIKTNLNFVAVKDETLSLQALAFTTRY